jgi:hypothetical protein
MDLDGLIAKMYDIIARIAEGREWLFTEGVEAEGRVLYLEGLRQAIEAFSEVKAYAATHLDLLLRAEQSCLIQELQFCDPSDADSINSLKQAIADYDDALIALSLVSDSAIYRYVDMSYPRKGKYRIDGMPLDAVHAAIISHRARIKNSLRTTGVHLLVKELLKQRLQNLEAVKDVYLEKQKAVLAQPEPEA